MIDDSNECQSQNQPGKSFFRAINLGSFNRCILTFVGHESFEFDQRHRIQYDKNQSWNGVLNNRKQKSIDFEEDCLAKMRKFHVTK